MKRVSIEREYCEDCQEDTEHEVFISRDAESPPEEFIEAEQEGYASQADCIFYANGDPEYEHVCRECGNRYTTI